MLTLLKNSHAHALPREVALYVQYDLASPETALEITTVAEEIENFYFGKCRLTFSANCPVSRQRESSSEEQFLSNVRFALQGGSYQTHSLAEECKFTYEFSFSKDSSQRKLSLVIKEKTTSGSILFVKAEFDEQKGMNMMSYLSIIGETMKLTQSKLHELEKTVSDGNQQIASLLQDITAVTTYKDTIQTELLRKTALLLNSKARELQRRQQMIDSLQQQLDNLTSDGTSTAAVAAVQAAPSKVVKISKGTKASKATATRKRTPKLAAAEDDEALQNDMDEDEVQEPLPAKRKRATRATATSVDTIMKKVKNASVSSRTKRSKKVIDEDDNTDDNEDEEGCVLLGKRRAIKDNDSVEEGLEEEALDSNDKDFGEKGDTEEEEEDDDDDDDDGEKHLPGRSGSSRGRLQAASQSSKSSFLPTPNIDIVDSGELEQLLRSQQNSSSSESGIRSVAGSSSSSIPTAPTHLLPLALPAAAAAVPRRKTALEKKFDSSSDDDDGLNSYL